MPMMPALAAALACAEASAVVDRIEDRIAVVETADEALVDVPLALFPADVREGDRVLLAACRASTSRTASDAEAPHGAVASTPPGTEQPGVPTPIGETP